MSSSQGGSATLMNLRSHREDVVHLKSDLSVNTQLILETSKLRTYPGSIVTVTNRASSAVIHNSTAFTVLHGYVAGTLNRYVQANTIYDFPVGYQNPTTFSPPNHRRMTIDMRNMSGINDVEVTFTTPVNDCNGQFTVNDGVLSYSQIHPEGS